MVVLWPRIIPRSESPEIRTLASKLQVRLRATVAGTLPGRTIDQRPEPQRVCPRAGCNTLSAGVLLLHAQGGCAAVGMFSPRGQSTLQLAPWLGVVKLKNVYVPFREPPESFVQVLDYVPCATAVDALAAGDPELADTLRAVLLRDAARK